MFLPTFLAQTEPTETSSSIELDWPYLWSDWVPITLLLLALAASIVFSRRDTRHLSRSWTLFLTGLRCLFLALALVIALNPHQRTSTEAFRPSRVLLLVDTSTSMQQPVREAESSEQASGRDSIPTRMQAVLSLLQESPLLDELRETHHVDVYSFDNDLSQLHLRLPVKNNERTTSAASPAAEGDEESTAAVDWESLLKPEGLYTRLGDSLDQLLIEAKSSTLSGVIVVSDGAINAGRDVSVPRERATADNVRLVAVGVGSTVPPTNLEVARLISPTDVQKGDSFELSAILRGKGVAGRPVQVELLQQGPNDPEPIIVLTETTSIADESVPTEVSFELKPGDDGEFVYTVRASLPSVIETREDDNQLSRTVNVFDRPLKVLVIAGGPMRDYQFARNALYRHPSAETEIWLQSGGAGISQEANRLLFRFPDSREALFNYDVILAFDPDWSRLTEEQQTLLAEWISNEGGGLFVVAGDVNTPRLAAGENLDTIRRLYPVLLEEVSLRLGVQDAATTAFPWGLTQEGQVAEFLKLDESGERDVWQTFPGVFRTYPTRGAKAGTTIYAEFTDPLSRGAGGQPILLAGQRYGQGQVLYLGSPEMWRLRALDEGYYDRFWIKTVRKSAEGRSKRGLQRSLFILDGSEFELGQTVPLRVRALTPQFEPLVSDTIALELFGPGGNLIVPGPELLRDPLRPGEFVGSYRPLLPGNYRFEFEVPESTDRVMQAIDVQFPRQEAASLVQEVEQLQRLVDGTGGAYVPLAEAAERVPGLLPDRGETVTIDQKVEELWDRQFLMVLMSLLVAGEWLTRKLLKLA